jgi:hypothetical protein
MNNWPERKKNITIALMSLPNEKNADVKWQKKGDAALTLASP